MVQDEDEEYEDYLNLQMHARPLHQASWLHAQEEAVYETTSAPAESKTPPRPTEQGFLAMLRSGKPRMTKAVKPHRQIFTVRLYLPWKEGWYIVLQAAWDSGATHTVEAKDSFNS